MSAYDDTRLEPAASQIERLTLNDSHRLRIGALIGGMRDLLDELHRNGIDGELTADVEHGLTYLERTTRARRSKRGDQVGAALGRLWVLTCELRAKSLDGYGSLGDRERAFLDKQAASLEQSVRTLNARIRPPG